MLGSFFQRGAGVAARPCLRCAGTSSGAPNRCWSDLLQVYQGKVRAGDLREDPRQEAVVERLGRLSNVLETYKPPEQLVMRQQQPVQHIQHLEQQQPPPQPPRWQQKKQSQEAEERPIPRWDTHLRPRTIAKPQSLAGSAAPRHDQPHDHHASHAGPAPGATSPQHATTRPSAPEQAQQAEKDAISAAEAAAAARVRVPRGAYIYGEVGSGKSMLVDLFYERCAVAKKRRVHFHQFMLEVHQRVHEAKQHDLAHHGRQKNIKLEAFVGTLDPVRRVAREIASEAWLLCFDEFQVTDVADALIMRTLFSELWQCGTVCVFTSNRPPSLLYEGGVNREYFVPWIDALSRQCAVVAVGQGADHRQRTAELPGQYHTPLSPRAAVALEAQLAELTDHGPLQVGVTVPVRMGRTLSVPRSARGVAAFSFSALCERNHSAADYRALCENFHTLVLAGVPALSTAQHNEARRFITLIDELYEARVRLLVSADAKREDLFQNVVAHVTGSTEPHGAAPLTSLGTDRPGGPAAQAPKAPKAPGSHSDAPLHPIRPEDLLPGQVDPASDDVGVLEGELAAVTELAFAFRRASSRLREMASEEYLLAHWEMHAERYRSNGTSILKYIGSTHPEGAHLL